MAHAFLLRLAGHTVRVSHRYPLIRDLCTQGGFAADTAAGTPTETTADTAAVPTAAVPTVSVTDGDLAAERETLGCPAPDGYLESLALERAIARTLAPMGTFHMHAVALAVHTADGREAYVFLADSGVGKSTHVRRWMHAFGDRAEVICDDKPFFSFADGVLYAHGSPWRGKEGWGTNHSVPVKAFCILERGAENVIARAEPDAAMTAFFAHVFLPEDAEGASAVLAAADRVLSEVPFWHLFCTPDPEAAEVAYHALSSKEKSL